MNWMLSILPWFHHQRQPGRQPALDAEINQRTGKATTMLGPLTTRFWENPKLTVATNIAVNEACIISTLLYGSEAWTIYAKQERKLNSLHMRSLHLILGIIWSERVAQVLKRASLPNMYTLLRQRRLCWLGHLRRMEDGRIPKDI